MKAADLKAWANDIPDDYWITFKSATHFMSVGACRTTYPLKKEVVVYVAELEEIPANGGGDFDREEEPDSPRTLGLSEADFR